MHYLRSLVLSLSGYLLFFGNDYAISQSTGVSNAIYDTRFPNVTWNNELWQVRTQVLDQGHYQSRMSICNGYLGINVAALGPFFEADTPVNGDNINGWPLFSERQTFATISGFFDSQPTTNGTNFEWLNQYGGESVISGVPHWSGLIVELDNGKYLDASTDSSEVSNFSSTLDAKAGTTSWSYSWSPTDSGDVSFDISYIMFANKLYISQAIVQLEITPSMDVNVSIVNIFDGTSAVRTNFVESGMDSDTMQLFSAVKPAGIENVTAYFYAAMEGTNGVSSSTLALVNNKPYLGANDSSIAQAAMAALKAGQTTTVTKYVGGASSDGFADPQGMAKNSSLNAMRTGFEQSLIYHKAEWAEIFPSESVDNYTCPENNTLPLDDFIIESQITAVLNPYYLLQNTLSTNALANVHGAPIDTNSISVGGLASDSYGGQVFWDAEIWMQPGIAITFPAAVRQIAKYRVERYAQAKANAQTAYQSSKANTSFSSDAAVYSWTSGRFGNCTGTGPCFDYEYHINGDIAQEFVNYWVASGDTAYFESTLFPIYNSIATFYSEALIQNGTRYALHNLTDPDEYANHVDNGGFTMPLIADTLANANLFREQFGMRPNATWADQSANIFVSRSGEGGANIIEEYTGMNGSIEVKQADVVLDVFPLAYRQNYTTEDGASDLEYYAGKQSLSGPGMTYAIFSIVANEVLDSGCGSYTYQQYSEQPYARAPWFQLSEQLVDDFEDNGGTHPAYPFLTGHGGANQVVPFGYLGLRLLPDYILHIDPSLPPQIPHLKLRTIYFHGHPISATMNLTHTTLTRPTHLPSLPTANKTLTTSPIKVQLSLRNTNNNNPPTTTFSLLPPNTTLTLPNRQPSSRKTTPNNIAQCAPVLTPREQSYQPGQFPFSVTDGTGSTKWIPGSANTTQSIVVDLQGVQGGPYQLVRGMYFDWAQAPPVNFSVGFGNSTPLILSSSSSSRSSSDGGNDGLVAVASQAQVAISAPYNPSDVAKIQRYRSNITEVEIVPPVWSGRYAVLTVFGNQNGSSSIDADVGASVAEWGIIAAE